MALVRFGLTLQRRCLHALCKQSVELKFIYFATVVHCFVITLVELDAPLSIVGAHLYQFLCVLHYVCVLISVMWINVA